MEMLIHICCADCGVKLIDAIKKEFGLKDNQIVLYFNNPNIHPESEWHARKNAVKNMLENSRIKLHIATWEPGDYFDSMKIHALQDKKFDINQKQHRCPVCWELRLKKTFEYAKDKGFEYISSTLFSSIYHDTEMITKIAQNLSEYYKINLTIPQNIDHCRKTKGFYKQNYEGCVFSLLDKMKQKYLKRHLTGSDY